MKIESDDLIDQLIDLTRQNINTVENFKKLSLEELNYRQSKMSWSALECIEHLNLYGDFYIPEIRKQIVSSKYAPVQEFKSGWIGNYFAYSMLPKEKLNKMKTFKDKDPKGSALGLQHLDRFINQQKEMIDLLDKSRKVNLLKTKTGISISRWIKFRLGDTFRFVINHNLRHLAQAEKVIRMSR